MFKFDKNSTMYDYLTVTNILTSRKITRGIAIIAVLVKNSTWCRRSIKYSPPALKARYFHYLHLPAESARSSALSTQSSRGENHTQPSSLYRQILPTFPQKIKKVAFSISVSFSLAKQEKFFHQKDCWFFPLISKRTINFYGFTYLL